MKMKYLLGSTALLSTLVLAGQPSSAEASTTDASSQNNQAHMSSIQVLFNLQMMS